MVSRRAIDLRIGEQGIKELARALRAEQDGAQLRKDLAREMRAALQPAVVEAKSGIMSMQSAHGSTGPALRSAIAKKVRAEVKLGGRWTGARVKARKTPNIRNFQNAPKRTQRQAGWRTQSYGNGVWRQQMGKRGWFDDPMQHNKALYKRAVFDAMEDMAQRIASRH